MLSWYNMGTVQTLLMQKTLEFSKLKFTVAIILKFIKGFQELYKGNFLKILILLSFLIEK